MALIFFRIFLEPSPHSARISRFGAGNSDKHVRIIGILVNVYCLFDSICWGIGVSCAAYEDLYMTMMLASSAQISVAKLDRQNALVNVRASEIEIFTSVLSVRMPILARKFAVARKWRALSDKSALQYLILFYERRWIRLLKI